MVTFTNEDCMAGMARYANKHFDLAIVDPPYYSGPEKREYYGSRKSKTGVFRSYEKCDNWEIPKEEYFAELERVSKHYIVWGCNYFGWRFAPGRIVWDKCNGSSTFSDAEIAATDLIHTVRLWPYMWNGMFQGKNIRDGRTQQGDKSRNEVRIHPTQKPIALYEWLLLTFARPGWKILDTHVGSASSLIACKRLGYDVTGFELDRSCFVRACTRMAEEFNQVSLFDEVDNKPWQFVDNNQTSLFDDETYKLFLPG